MSETQQRDVPGLPPETVRRASPPPVRIGGIALALGLACTAAVLEFLVLPDPALEERSFLAAADAVRTAIASFYLQGLASGTPRLPTTLAQLGEAGHIVDPWTGVADWGTLRDRQGAIVGIYSRSGHPVRDSGRLATLATLRSELAARDVAVLGVSAWAFRWEPPARDTAVPVAGPLTALAALQGRWPAVEPPLVASAAQVLGNRLLLSEAPFMTARERGRATFSHAAEESRDEAPNGIGARGPAGFALTRSEEGLTKGPAWSVFVPIGPEAGLPSAEVAQEDSTGWVQQVPTPPLDDSGTAIATADSGLQKVSDDGAGNGIDPEFRLSTDPRTRRCQLALQATQPRQVCSASVDADDNGQGYEACLRDLAVRVAACVQGR